MVEIVPADYMGRAQVDQILQSTVSRSGAVFPGRIRGCYLSGNYADVPDSMAHLLRYTQVGG